MIKDEINKLSDNEREFFSVFCEIKSEKIDGVQSTFTKSSTGQLNLSLRAKNNECCPLDFIVTSKDKSSYNYCLLLEGSDDVFELYDDDFVSNFSVEEQKCLRTILTNPITIKYYMIDGKCEKMIISYVELSGDEVVNRDLKIGLFGISHLFNKGKYSKQVKHFVPWIKW